MSSVLCPIGRSFAMSQTWSRPPCSPPLIALCAVQFRGRAVGERLHGSAPGRDVGHAGVRANAAELRRIDDGAHIPDHYLLGG